MIKRIIENLYEALTLKSKKDSAKVAAELERVNADKARAEVDKEAINNWMRLIERQAQDIAEIKSELLQTRADLREAEETIKNLRIEILQLKNENIVLRKILSQEDVAEYIRNRGGNEHAQLPM